MPPPGSHPAHHRGTSTTPPRPLRDQEQHGPLVILRVRALVPEKVKLSDPAQGTVRATVLAIDEEINQVKVQTDEGQRLVLFLPPASLARLHLGTPCLLQVARRRCRTPHDRQSTKGPSGKAPSLITVCTGGHMQAVAASVSRIDGIARERLSSPVHRPRDARA